MTTIGKDITDLEDIKIMVDHFYDKVRTDLLLGDLFNPVLKDKWPWHLEKMYRFWQTVLLEEHTYYGSPFPPHATMPLQYNHFNRWLTLFTETVNEHFSGEKAERAKWQGERMAQLFLSKIHHYQSTSVQQPS